MMIEIPTATAPAEAWLAGTEGPGVLMVMDVFGVRPTLCEMADRVASWGYIVLVPNVFHREGRVGDLAPAGPLRVAEVLDAAYAVAGPRVGRLSSTEAAADVSVWLDWLTRQPGVRQPFGVVGYCMGARIATRAAGAHPDLVAACAGFHGGGLATDAPDSPHLSLPGARAEFAYGHADQDRSMGPEAVERFDEALDAADLVATTAVYADAPHGFTMADTPSYRAKAAERHFTALEDLFARQLRG